jgi:hypothetical protein
VNEPPIAISPAQRGREKATNKPDNASTWMLKCLAISVPPVILEDMFRTHSHLAFAVGIVGGALIQHLIPPRRHLFLVLGLASAAAFLNAILL